VTNVPIISWLSGLLEKLLIRRTDALILQSERQILQVETRNLPEKTIFFYNAPSSSFKIGIHDKRLADSEDEGVFTLFYPGELSHDRVKLLVNVINAVKGLPVRIVIAGFGEYEGLLRRYSEDNEQLAFLGYLDHQKVMELTEKADLILLTYDPSYANNRIGLPNKLFEAMACGSLILAPHGTYMGEVVEKEKIGMIVDYNDPAEIRRVMKSIIERGGETIQLLRENAKRLYIEKYNPEKLDRRYLKTIKSLALQARTGHPRATR
jgi:glycosyltransferase involved in cell wall biosynthesis